MTQIRNKLQPLIGLFIIMGILMIFAPTIRQWTAIRDILEQSTVMLIMATGTTIVLISGNLDLSVGSILALVTVVVGNVLFLELPVAVAIAAGLSAFTGYAVISFFPSFIVRSYDMEIVSLGVWLGLILGIAGGFGFFLGGYFADRIGQQSHRKALGFLAASTLLATLFNAGVFMSTSMFWCLLLLIIPSVISNFYLAPVLGQTQSLVSLRMRAVASSLVLLILNVIALLIGQPITGFISDAYAASMDIESMRYALLTVSVAAMPVAAWCYWRAGRSIEADLARATEHD